MEPSPGAFSFGPRNELAGSGAILVRDSRASIPLTKVLTGDSSWIVMLVPTPATESSISPYQPLAEAIDKRHPGQTHFHYYTPKGGFTGVHTRFIKHPLCKVIIIIIQGAILEGQKQPLGVAETALVACGDRTHVILACDNIYQTQLDASEFPTIIKIHSLSELDVEAAANLLFGQPSSRPSSGVQVQSLMIAPKVWPIETIYQTGSGPPPSDFDAIYRLWIECLPPTFALPPDTLQCLLWRDGFARHYVVREEGTRQILGFCATYYTFADSGGQRLVGCLSAILVAPSCRNMGIGLSLHNHALQALRSLGGVYRLKLGSIFPRLLYGIPLNSPFEGWFRRRGWTMDDQRSGSSQIASDWVITFDQWQGVNISPAGLVFRHCQPVEFNMALDFVSQETLGKNDGWYDEYAKLEEGQHVSDIIMGLEGNNTVATAIVYTAGNSTCAAEDLPWMNNAGNDIGGHKLMILKGDDPAMRNGRSSVVTRLLNACATALVERGARGMFLDAMKDSGQTLRSLGFQEYATYRDAWREI
ncbi:hypothetical protein MKZ38_010587 [Zalerion maritima]|uniref:N-acetyltransferase domain-containing protein n=1 Tax=Zalerion maritima TaxID=339359 RepID=A0AAD5RS87_9PEZI|nr:hypothetical protein MKZ38_010587 [Zalerion maritima]